MGCRQGHPQTENDTENILYYSAEDYRNSTSLRSMHIIEPDRYKNCSGKIASIYQCQICLRYAGFADLYQELPFMIVCKNSKCVNLSNVMLGRKKNSPPLSIKMNT